MSMSEDREEVRARRAPQTSAERSNGQRQTSRMAVKSKQVVSIMVVETAVP